MVNKIITMQKTQQKHVNGLVQDCSKSIANPLELL